MSLSTAKWKIPYLQASDPIANTDDVDAAAAARQDLLLGESGFITISPAAATTLTTVITLSRTYNGNNTLFDSTGHVFVNLIATLGSGTTFNWWVNTFTGTTTTITGFSLSVQFSAAQTSRVILWRYFPVSG